MTVQDIEIGRKNAIISYLTIFGTIIAFYLNNEKKSEFATFHIRQALGLWLTFFALGYIVGSFDSWLVSMGFYIFFAVLFVFGFGNAVGKKAQPIPLVGALYQRMFANLGK
ncbi:hypothetical protein [Algibacter lectus]|uniref:Uncharacterized protein n=1 Tax=Algibacter lectus TaxID=221126 RepID=A0A090WXJ7_9FLAO|nr:hypothetical protein [Algibacter lectus]MWW25147.1 hypothetical protein [Algibacter lectus]TDY64439.1 hypothetical protein DFQ06_1349 [Algibacter lectus]SFD48702.1 hypothetical protein SAMN04489722_110127 [Algibacter lectus]GAL61105.1 hypothetical protein JCM19300_4051 [Algibacter lectus]GAL80154.1 hypothetical protein JCM19274_3724 [Algibacter lectus]